MSTTITNSIPVTLNDLLVKLKVLSKLENGQKINMGNMSFVSASSYSGAFSRGLNGEGRKSLIVNLNQIITQSINAINEYHGTEFCQLIVNELAKAKVGIQTLTTTYREYPQIVAEIEVCVDNIDIQLKKNRALLEGHQVAPLITPAVKPSDSKSENKSHNDHK